MRIALAFAATLAVIGHAGDARAQAKMGVGKPCGKAPDFVCVPFIQPTAKDPVTLSTLKLTAPSAGKASVTFQGYMQCDFRGAADAVIQIRTDKEKPEVAPGGVKIAIKPQFIETVPISLTAYFDVVKGVNRFNAQATFEAQGLQFFCSLRGGQMGYTFLPE
jgi:hypothetical protein